MHYLMYAVGFWSLFEGELLYLVRVARTELSCEFIMLFKHCPFKIMLGLVA